jgi:hypothetical protein
MSKQWYFQVMGAEVGPLSPMELADKVKRGQIQADTLIRKGADGKWTPADRIKGLLSPPDAEPPLTAKAPTATKSDTIEPNKPADSAPTPSAGSQTAENESTYHLDGDKAAAVAAIAQQPSEFDFFQFVGFRQAITPPLHEVLEAYARQHHLTFTQITRRALAQFLGHPELGEETPAGSQPESPSDGPLTPTLPNS